MSQGMSVARPNDPQAWFDNISRLKVIFSNCVIICAKPWWRLCYCDGIMVTVMMIRLVPWWCLLAPWWRNGPFMIEQFPSFLQYRQLHNRAGVPCEQHFHFFLPREVFYPLWAIVKTRNNLHSNNWLQCLGFNTQWWICPSKLSRSQARPLLRGVAPIGDYPSIGRLTPGSTRGCQHCDPPMGLLSKISCFQNKFFGLSILALVSPP